MLNVIKTKNMPKHEAVTQIVGVGISVSTSRQLDPMSPLLLYPRDIPNIAVSRTFKKTIAIDHSDDSSVSMLTPDATPLQEIFHTALQLPADLKESPGHDTSWHGIDMDHVSNFIINSLYLFSSVLFGGDNIPKLEEQNNSLKVRICSIAQDIIYTASKSRKLTPKHVGLGLALHQATRSEKMVNIFHAAGHTFVIITLSRIDSSIANDISRKYEQNGYIYIPTGISPYTPGRIILSSFDNIDVLEEKNKEKKHRWEKYVPCHIMCFVATWATVTTRANDCKNRKK